MLPRLIVLILLTVAATIVHGRMTNRWGAAPELQVSSDFVDALPKQFGEWQYVEDAKEMAEGVKEELGVSTYASRVYGKKTAAGTQTVSLMLLAGKTGRLIRHLPHICYAASGNTFLTEPKPITLDVDGTQHQFKVLPIRPASDLSGDFVVVYGFAHNGVFLSPEMPRLQYHGIPAVEKIQILCTRDPDQPDGIPAYAQSFVEEICRHFQNNQRQ